VLKGLARDPVNRFTTAREMALAIEQTIGLASPSAVGEWVESVSGDELQRRAQTIAAIEVASLNTATATPRSAMARPVEGPHSQVSSISVSRPAIPIAPQRRSSHKVMVSFFALLALLGGGLGGMAMRNVLTPARHREAKVADFDKRGLAVISPQLAQAKGAAGKEAPAVAAVPVARTAAAPVQAPPKVVIGDTAKKTNCDPPYTLDTAGHKHYKLECLK
jgi:serine/threonine-protein kinase